MAPKGFFDINYLKLRVLVHELHEIGFDREAICRKTDLDQRKVARYLAMGKPKLRKPGRDQEWRLYAACSSYDTDLFFPDVQGNGARKRKEQAKEICGMCPVIDKCREEALANYEQHGVWAGEDFSQYSYTFNEETGEVSVKEKSGPVTKVS